MHKKYLCTQSKDARLGGVEQRDVVVVPIQFYVGSCHQSDLD